MQEEVNMKVKDVMEVKCLMDSNMQPIQELLLEVNIHMLVLIKHVNLLQQRPDSDSMDMLMLQHKMHQHTLKLQLNMLSLLVLMLVESISNYTLKVYTVRVVMEELKN